VERRYSSYSFSTSALDVGEWSASRPGRALATGKGPLVPIVQEAGWAPELVWTQRLRKNPFACAGIESRSPGRPAPSQTLYWLSYPAHFIHFMRKKNIFYLIFLNVVKYRLFNIVPNVVVERLTLLIHI
jgi:hypothetical protein